MKKASLLFAVIGLATILVGCASGTKRDTVSTSSVISQKVIISPTTQLASVSMSATAEVNDKQGELKERGFSTDALLAQLKKQLNDNSLLVPSQSKSNLSLEIFLDGVRFRTTAQAIWAGFMAGSDYIKATVYVKDVKGTTLDKFQVETSYAFGGLAGGPAETRSQWLYDNFGKEIVKELTGATNDGGAK